MSPAESTRPSVTLPPMPVSVRIGDVEAQHNEDLTQLDEDDPDICGITINP